MFLDFSVLTPSGKNRNFYLVIDNIDMCFGLLTTVVAMGDILLWAELVDTQHGLVQLPVEAFDGYAMLKDLQALQAEWEQVLARVE